jgi:hypothetical protein
VIFLLYFWVIVIVVVDFLVLGFYMELFFFIIIDVFIGILLGYLI